MIKITAQDILVTHIQVCHVIGKPAEIDNPHVLNDIERQLKTNLQWFTDLQAASYVGMQIRKLKPFSYANNATAVAITKAVLGMADYDSLGVDKIYEALGASSVVDEVAEKIVA